MDAETRIERDSLGELQVPRDALYAAQTQRAVQNFAISGLRLPKAFIDSLLLIKQAAAAVNKKLGLLDANIADAIEQAAAQVREQMPTEQLDAQFPVDVFQTGSGTSTNMNANEVIATLASRLGTTQVDPNDHVNMGQSSNDVIPTAIHLAAAIELSERLLPKLDDLAGGIEHEMIELTDIAKTGRTHLMDAMPITLAQELSGWAAQIRSGMARLRSCQPRLHALAQGGTAVGTGINAHPDFAAAMAAELSLLTGLELRANENFFESLSCQDTAVELSGQLKTLAVSVMKIANDLRWMNSGPLSGLGEIELEALQPGSSIMPGKINPVVPEAATMVAAQVIGNDATITIGGQAGNFQLNLMLPVIAYNLLQSIDLLSNIARALDEDVIKGFSVQTEHLTRTLARNPILVTALNPIIGYSRAAEIAKAAYLQKRPVIEVAAEMTELSTAELTRLLDPRALTEGGIRN